MNNRPIIALPVRPSAAPRHANWYDAVEAAGGKLADIWEGYGAAEFDGLLIPGGGDVDPAFYHRPLDGGEPPDRELDEHQFAAIGAFVRAGKPILGVCRGHQVLNVYFGGTLIQDIPTQYAPPGGGAPLNHSQVDDRDDAHMTHALPGSFVAGVYGMTELPVNTAHHQAVEIPGEGFEVVQWAEDGTVEAMRHKTLPVFALQWHPERMCLKHARADTVDGLKIIRYFVERAVSY